MNSKTLSEKFELLPASSFQDSIKNKLAGGLRAFLNQLVQVLAPSQEPRIHSRSTQDGQTRFDAYDPVTHQHIRGVSEQSLRIWLEQRYYAASKIN